MPDNIPKVEDKNSKQYPCTHRAYCLQRKGRKYKQDNKTISDNVSNVLENIRGTTLDYYYFFFWPCQGQVEFYRPGIEHMP